MNKERMRRIYNVKSLLENANTSLESLVDEEQYYNDNIPDNLRSSIAADNSDNDLDILNEIVDLLNEAIDNFDELI